MKKPRFVARILDSKTVQAINPTAWLNWLRTPEAYRGIGYRAGEKPPETGSALVQSPYTDYYNLVWGLAPNQDMPKWRWMYRARPEIKRGMDMKATLAVGRGFSVVCEDDADIETYANRLLEHLNIRDILQSAVTDALIYGQAYFEKVRAVKDELQEQEEQELGTIEVTRKWSSFDLDKNDSNEATKNLKAWTDDIQVVDRWLEENRIDNASKFEAKKFTFKAWMARLHSKSRFQAQERIERPVQKNLIKDKFDVQEGELVELKPLDPLWMRVNRDAFGNVTGFVQWGLTPIPIALISEKIAFFRWMPKSWAHENAYGTSVLMPIQRHVSLLIQAEEDMKVYWHQYAKPMLLVSGGIPEKPYPFAMMKALAAQFANRQPNTDAVVPGNVEVKVISAGTGETSKTFAIWAKYLREKIYEDIGIPSILMNLPGEVTRATSDVSLQAFIADERMIQEMMGEQILKQILEPEIYRKFAGKYPDGNIPVIKAIWPPILEEDRNKKLDRLIKSTGRPFMSVNEARSEAGLPPLEGEQYDKPAEVSMPGFGQASKGPEMSESERTGSREEEQQKIDSDNMIP